MEEKNKYRVIISKRAAQMLVSHASFLANVSKNAAERLVKTFQTAAHSLEEFPHRCPWMIADCIPPNKYRYLIFEKRYLIIFQIRDETVYVDHVVDCRQDYAWLLR